MNRRDALKSVAALLGAAVVGSSRFLDGQVNADAGGIARRFTKADLALLDEVGETILPATPDSPGAKAARIGAFMRDIVSTTYNEEERADFFAGIEALDALSRDRFGGGFMQLDPEERLELLLLLELERRGDAPYYRMMKELTIWGYFSSEVGATQALRHLPVPGRWEPCIEVSPDAKAWA